MKNFDLAAVCIQEAERRLKLLGNLVDADYDPDELRTQARSTRLPRKVLLDWFQSYKLKGMEGLIPEWAKLDEDEYELARKRYEELGDLVDTVMLTNEQIDNLAIRTNWSKRTAERWLTRYRIGGLWGLAPKNNPTKSHRKQKEAYLPRELATLNGAELEVVFTRRQLLGDLATKSKVTNEEVQAQAASVGVSERTIWNYLRDYRNYGLMGLGPRLRSDKGKHHGISERMVEIVEGIRLSHLDWSTRAVWEEACKRACNLNEPEPTEYQVRSICDNIPTPVKLLADGRRDEFRSKYRFTYPIKHEHLVYQIDHTEIDVLVKDIRSPKYRRHSGEIRPWLTLCIDSQSRLVMAARFGYDEPNRFVVAAAIRDALLISEDKSYGGIPNEIWVDNGKELVSKHVQQLTRELGIALEPRLPGQPQHKGIVERFFETLNTRLWSRLPGYVNSNVVERNPIAKAELTLSELDARFRSFIQGYHNEVHSETGSTPLQFWLENCFAESVDLRLLDTLLKEPLNRRVKKMGISYATKDYWHPDLASLVGEDVLIRVEPSYIAPNEIEIYHNGRWICTAFGQDSQLGRSITPQQIADAQRQQNENIRQKIRRARGASKGADRQIEETKKLIATENVEVNSPKSISKPAIDKSKRTSQSSNKPRKPNFFERLINSEEKP